MVMGEKVNSAAVKEGECSALIFPFRPLHILLPPFSFWAFVSGVGRGRGDGMGCSVGRVSEVVIVRLSVRPVRWVDRRTNHVLVCVPSKFGELGV